MGWFNHQADEMDVNFPPSQLKFDLHPQPPTQELDESLSKLESSKGLGETIPLDEKQIKQVPTVGEVAFLVDGFSVA